ncbi:hypothetical protein PHLCEN_2v1106 [Hermanssonia centrifuga]|uniref:F-box domain-containing protein n=1 Tax=Hermanssonia centrifuga TaxID=98765 RepID=A0A2R6S456_9APHY|nr:hypothetical protein PHLCEN_2v1106 [Hermanssonia centrifuga]
MANRVPEEILREILVQLLVISAEAFSGPCFAMYEDAPYPSSSPLSSRLSSKSSLLLLVCKQWLRIGSPLFYEAVVLSTTSQVQTLATTVHSMPSLGLAIKRLRLGDVSYDRDLHSIVELAPNIHTLSLSMDIACGRSISSFCSTLSKIHPVRLMLKSEKKPRDTDVGEVERALVLCLAQWTSLTRVDLSNWFYLKSWFADVLRQIPSLQCLSMGYMPIWHDMEYCRLEGGQLLSVVQNPALRSILCRSRNAKNIEWMGKDRPQCAEVMKLLRIENHHELYH